MKKLSIYSLSIILILTANSIYGQLSEGGLPYSFRHDELKTISNLKFETMPSFDVQAMIEEDSINQGPVKAFHFAKGFDVSFSLNNSGTWETLENGDKVWRLGIRSPFAKSINLIFSEYNIPDGAKVFIFNQKTSDVIGGFTSKNNSLDNILATMPVKGDEIVVEYFEPKSVSFIGRLTIGKVSHDYRGVTKACYDPPNDGSCYGLSGECQVDINCSEGNSWQNEKNAVCRIFINGEYLCSASLLNNTAQDGTPYILTANHCVCSNSLANTVVAVFNYDSPSCDGADGPLNQSISGLSLKANWANTDFALLQYSTLIPNSYNPYFLGWDKTGNAPSLPVTCIHHPSGDVKKISISNNSVNIFSINFYDSNVPCEINISKDTWRISYWSTGATESGSSGSPLFGNTHRVIGQLYAGYSYCGYPFDDFYGRFSTSWSGNNTNSTRLQNWLDPSNTLSVLPGLRYVDNQTYTSNTTITGDNVKLNNVTIQNNASIIVDFNNNFSINGPFDIQIGSTLTVIE